MSPVSRYLATSTSLVLILFSITLARADIVFFTGGEQRSGVVLQDSPDDDSILFLTTTGELRINRSRVDRIEREEPYLGHIRIGDEFFKQNNLEQALSQYKTSKEMKPEAVDLDERIQKVEQALDARAKEERAKVLDQMNVDLNQLSDMIDKRDFAAAERLLNSVSAQQPTTEQSERIRRLRLRLYYTWANDRLDKLDRPGAAKYFEMILDIDPNYEDAFDHLLELWSSDPTKTERVIAVYQKKLSLSPDDNTLNAKLADLYYGQDEYAKALPLYLKVYETGNLRDTDTETRIRKILPKVAADRSATADFEGAINLYTKFLSLFPNEDPTPLAYYKYYDLENKLPRDSTDSWLKLAEFARSNGLDEKALSKARDVLGRDINNTGAKAIIAFYASGALNEAQFLFDQQQYQLAVSQAEKVIKEFPQAPEQVQRANDIIEKSKNELARLQRDRGRQAQELVAIGQGYYDRALYHINNLGSTERRATT
ncbi:MAG: hypothetical protein V2A74_01340, partial [bacterium]